jgi:hypothetical protein
VARAARLRLNNVAELTAAADRIAALGHEFAARVTGDQLAAVDPLLPDADQYKGTPYQVPSDRQALGPRAPRTPWPRSASRPPVRPGSTAPYTAAKRHAEPERWDVPFSADMTEADVDFVLAALARLPSTRADRFPASIPVAAAS